MANPKSLVALDQSPQSPFLLPPKDVATLWLVHTQSLDGIRLSAYFVNLAPDEVALLDFICELKPEFRCGRRVDWTVVRKLFAESTNRSEPEAMRLIQSLEQKELVTRRGDMMHLVWQLKGGKFVADGTKLIRSQDKNRKRSRTEAEYLPKLQLAQMQSGGKCVYCGRNAVDGKLDHAIPKSRGGAGGVTSGNLVLTCKICNTAKGDMSPEEWALSILQYRTRLQSGRPSRLVTFILSHRDLLPKLAHRINSAITVVLVLLFLGWRTSK